MNEPPSVQIEREISETLRKLSLIQFAIMEKSGNYGAAGRERVLSGFCRHLLNLSPKIELTPEHTRTFWQEIEVALEPYRDLSLQELKALAKNTHFILDGHKYIRNEDHQINELLAEVGSEKRVAIGSVDNDYQVMFFGPTQIRQKGDFTVSLVQAEEARSPSSILPMIAVIGKGKHIFIRKEALRVIFTEKWRSLFLSANQHHFSQPFFGDHWKKLTLRNYGIVSQEGLEKAESLFVDEMIETTVAHEVSHGLFEKDYPDKELIALAKVFALKPEGMILEILGELFAEWLPGAGVLCGAIPYILSQSEKDKGKKTERMLSRYISDSWFLGNFDQHYLADTTDLFATPLLSFLQTDGSFAISALTAFVATIYSFFLAEWERILIEIRNQIKSAKFNIRGTPVSFEVASIAQRRLIEKDNRRDLLSTEVLYQSHFYENMVKHLARCAPETHAAILVYLREQNQVVKDRLLALLVKDPKEQKKWQGNLRGYLLEQCRLKLDPLVSVSTTQ